MEENPSKNMIRHILGLTTLECCKYTLPTGNSVCAGAQKVQGYPVILAEVYLLELGGATNSIVAV